MRRKCFFVFLLSILLIFVLDHYSVNLYPKSNNIVSLAGENHEYILKVQKYKCYDDHLALTCEIKSIDNMKFNCKGYVLLNAYIDDYNYCDILYKHIIYNGSFSIPQGERNPHCFNYLKYLKSTKVFLSSSCSYINFEKSKNNLFEKYVIYLHILKKNFESNLIGDSKGIILGLLFGDTSNLDDDIYNAFRNNGTSHILAISGLHITVIYSILEKLTKRKSKRFQLIFILFFLISYGYMCLWSISIKRAIIMIFLKMIAIEFDLRYDTLTAISITGLILILNNPYVIFQTGFEISFLAVISIVVLSKKLKDNVPDFLVSSLAVTTGIVGLQAYIFNYISPLSIFVNVPIILLASYIVPSALFVFIISIFLNSKLNIFLKLLNVMGTILVKINNISTIKGISSLDVTRNFSLILLAISIMVLFFNFEYTTILKLRNNYKVIIRNALIITLIFISFIVLTYNPITNCDVVFIDVGQGDSIHIRDGSLNTLIDGGGNINYNIGNGTLKPYLLKNNVNNLDLALLTHTHSDHYRGIVELNEVFKIKEIVTESIKGDKYTLSKDVYIETIWPIDKTVSKDENKNCSVYIIHYKGYKIMITGDLDEEGEKMILNYYSADYLKCDILKIGHHGSDTSTCDEFLNVVSPKVCVIQVGKNNYGHPTQNTLDKLKKHNILYFRNDLNGAIGIKFTKHGIKINKIQ